MSNPAAIPVPRRDTAAWKLQVWIAFGQRDAVATD